VRASTDSSNEPGCLDLYRRARIDCPLMASATLAEARITPPPRGNICVLAIPSPFFTVTRTGAVVVCAVATFGACDRAHCGASGPSRKIDADSI
jgi:hypothetical protein